MRPISLIVLILLGLLGVSSLRADMPPEAGYQRVHTKIVLETNEAIPEYRFFMVSGDLVREIFLKPGEKTTVDSPGGGPRYGVGAVVAVPVKNLKQFGDDPAGEKTNDLKEAISGNKVGAIRLIDHHMFVHDVRDSEARDVRDAAYSIERDENGVKAVPLNNEQMKLGGISSGFYDVSRTVTPLGWTAIVLGGIGVTLVGVFGLRKFLRPSSK
ncbi:MAG TPA: hypothetical protein VHQ01_10390 [Pyrinomonadaceae bacterium]|nr:hypothetical protein [Pyrinomonadaceae bacterium]